MKIIRLNNAAQLTVTGHGILVDGSITEAQYNSVITAHPQLESSFIVTEVAEEKPAPFAKKSADRAETKTVEA
jgi:hypothetical protein